MLVNLVKTTNYSGVSAVNVTEEGKGEPVMYMNGAIDQEGNVTFGEQIRNIDLYKQHREEVDADYEAFKKQVIDDALEE